MIDKSKIDRLIGEFGENDFFASLVESINDYVAHEWEQSGHNPDDAIYQDYMDAAAAAHDLLFSMSYAQQEYNRREYAEECKRRDEGPHDTMDVDYRERLESARTQK